MENLKIVAQCENNNPTNHKLLDEIGDLRIIRLAKSFLELNDRDQLMVVKACLKTHYDLFKGSVPAFGKVLFYVLCIPDAENNITCYRFDTNGKYQAKDNNGIC